MGCRTLPPYNNAAACSLYTNNCFYHLIRPLAGLSIWKAVKSFNNPLEDVRQTPSSCVWVHNDAQVAVDGGDGANVSLWQYPFDAAKDLRHQLQELLIASVANDDVNQAETEPERQCDAKEGALLKDMISPKDVFLRSVCDTLASTTTERKTTCYGRVVPQAQPHLADFDNNETEHAYQTRLVNDAAFARQAKVPLDCRNSPDQHIIRNELQVVDCWQWRRFDVSLWATHITIGFAVAGVFLKMFNAIDSVFSIGKAEASKKTACSRTVGRIVFIVSPLSLFLYVGLVLPYGTWAKFAEAISFDPIISGLTYEESKANLQRISGKNPVQERAFRSYLIYAAAFTLVTISFWAYLFIFDRGVPEHMGDRWEILSTLFHHYGSKEEEDEGAGDGEGSKAREAFGRKARGQGWVVEDKRTCSCITRHIGNEHILTACCCIENKITEVVCVNL